MVHVLEQKSLKPARLNHDAHIVWSPASLSEDLIQLKKKQLDLYASACLELGDSESSTSSLLRWNEFSYLPFYKNRMVFFNTILYVLEVATLQKKIFDIFSSENEVYTIYYRLRYFRLNYLFTERNSHEFN